jgi:hypothetical protein
MTKPNDPGSTARWRGEEVEDESGDKAERGADRAENNAPIRADEKSKRQRAPSHGEPVDRVPPPRDPDSPDDSAEHKIAEAAEEHRARHPAGERPPRGKL